MGDMNDGGGTAPFMPEFVRQRSMCTRRSHRSRQSTAQGGEKKRDIGKPLTFPSVPIIIPVPSSAHPQGGTLSLPQLALPPAQLNTSGAMPADIGHIYTSLIQDYDMKTPTMPIPPGNYIARELRQIHDDSQSVFPESVYSHGTTRDRRWKSINHSDYLPIDELAEQADEKEERGRARDSGINEKAVADKGEKLYRDYEEKYWRYSRDGKMFMNWKVPTRLTEDGCSEKAVTPERAATSMSTGRKSNRSAIPSATGAFRRENTMPALPQIASAAPRLESRPATNQRQSRMSTRGSVRGRAPTTDAPPCSPVREVVPYTPKPKQSKGPKGYRTNEVLKTYYQPPTSDNIEGLLANATDSEKRMIEQALKLTAMGSSKTQPGKSLDGWLQGAGPKDREVALNFFKTLVKSKMIEGSPEKQHKIKALESELQRRGGTAQDPSLPYSSDPITEDKFRYIRILTPKTRRNKWMHQTWHHLPNYRDDNPVTNRSAIYTEPHKIMPRHFTIHPDWGV